MTHAIGIERAELLPCPFCGGEPSLTSGGPGNHYIRCMVCNAATDDTWKAEAIAAWNRRTALKPSGDVGEVVERHKPHLWGVMYSDNNRVDAHNVYLTKGAALHRAAEAAIPAKVVPLYLNPPTKGAGE